MSLSDFVSGAIRGAADSFGWSGRNERDALRREELYREHNARQDATRKPSRKSDDKQAARLADQIEDRA